MNVVLFEDQHYQDLLPLTWLRTASELRCGRDRLIDKIRTHIGKRIVRILARDSLRDVLADRIELADPVDDQSWCFVNTRVLATGNVLSPPTGTAWKSQGTLISATTTADEAAAVSAETFLDAEQLDRWTSGFRVEPAPEVLRLIEHPWDLIAANGGEIERQCTEGGVNEGDVHPSAHLLNAGAIHVASGVRIKPGVVLDAEEGPIHIESGAVIQSNAVIRGPCHIGPRVAVRALSVIGEGTSIGPVCKVGGEVAASILQGYTNKHHDGFLGHSFIAEWANIGADTISSDLKNTYGAIRMKINGVNVETGMHFLGSLIGDHAKTGIGTILPTGGVLGVAANVFTQTSVPKFVPSFAWLTNDGMTDYRIDKAIRIARTVMSRRERHLNDAEARLLEHVAESARQVEEAGWA